LLIISVLFSALAELLVRTTERGRWCDLFRVDLQAGCCERRRRLRDLRIHGEKPGRADVCQGQMPQGQSKGWRHRVGMVVGHGWWSTRLCSPESPFGMHHRHCNHNDNSTGFNPNLFAGKDWKTQVRGSYFWTGEPKSWVPRFEEAPLNPARGSGERCKFLLQGLGQSPSW